MGTGAGRHNFGDECHADREFTADTKPGQKAEDAEVPEIAGKGAETGKERVHEDGDEHGADASPAVAKDAEE